MKSVEVLDFCNRGGRNFSDLGQRPQLLANTFEEVPGDKKCFLLIAPFPGEEQGAAVGRILKGAAELEFLFHISVVIVMSGKLDGRMEGASCLNEHLAFPIPPSRPPRHLHKLLEDTFPARKSGRLREPSTLTTATQVTPGKSRPLAIICVPTKTSISLLPNRARARL